ncbi:MAG: metallophosphoesterase [Planctomycetota bacterium]|nr:metallophosphoesterase [Planctomycetota bacterium]
MPAQLSDAVKFLHTSDWQLGATRAFLSDEAQARWTASRFEAIRSLGQIAQKEECEFLVVAGDVFEFNQVDRRTVLRACEALQSISVPVFLLPGNHDPLDAGSIFESSVWKSNRPDHVHVLSDPKEPFQFRTGVEILGAPWFSKRPLADLVAEGIGGVPPLHDGVRVMVAHGATDELFPDRGNPALIKVEPIQAALAEGKIHYLALGDRHSLTEIGTSGRIWYSGTPVVYAFDEIDPGHALIVEIEGDSHRVHPVNVGTWRFVEKSFDIGSSADVDAVEHFLNSLERKEETVVRLVLVGTVTLNDHARLTEFIERYNDLFAGVHESGSQSDLVVVPDDADFADLSLSGFAAAAVDKLRAAAGDDGPEGEEARDALALLIRLAKAES